MEGKKIGPSHLLGSLVKNMKIYTKIRKSGTAPLNICHIWAQSSRVEAVGQQRSAFWGGTNSPGHKSGRSDWAPRACSKAGGLQGRHSHTVTRPRHRLSEQRGREGAEGHLKSWSEKSWGLCRYPGGGGVNGGAKQAQVWRSCLGLVEKTYLITSKLKDYTRHNIVTAHKKGKQH